MSMFKFISFYILAILSILLFPVIGKTQNFKIMDANFDDCTGTDIVNDLNGTLFGDPTCDCGVVNNGFEFDGLDDHIVFDQELSLFLQSDFTMSFYVWIENTELLPVDIFSLRESCEADSAFLIKYLPVTNQISVEYAENPSSIVVINAELPTDQCWHFVTITKRANFIQLYLDGIYIDEKQIIRPIEIDGQQSLSIANSPCLDFTDQRFRGKIDELQIFQGVLSEDDIMALYDYPDKIRTRDTTIILGSLAEISTGGTCSDNFSWSPATGLQNLNDPNPIASPETSTTYVWDINHGTCMTSDSVRINVVEESDVRCESLILPNAFTPNDDGINDKFGISNTFIIEQLNSFDIYDKWGSRLFSTDQISDNWDGTFKDNEVNPGTFLYKISYTCKGENFFKSGSFILLK